MFEITGMMVGAGGVLALGAITGTVLSWSGDPGQEGAKFRDRLLVVAGATVIAAVWMAVAAAAIGIHRWDMLRDEVMEHVFTTVATLKQVGADLGTLRNSARDVLPALGATIGSELRSGVLPNLSAVGSGLRNMVGGMG